MAGTEGDAVGLDDLVPCGEVEVRGSVYSYTTKRGERRWRVVFDALPDPLTGERRQTSKRGFATKAAAEAFLRRSLEEVTSGTYTQPSRVTVAEYLAEWLDGLRKKPTTMADYRQSARIYIGPRIGGVPLQALTPEHLDRLYRELETRGKRAGRCATAGVTCREHGCSPDRHGGLSPKSVRNVHGMLHRALQEAAERGHVPRASTSWPACPERPAYMTTRSPRRGCTSERPRDVVTALPQGLEAAGGNTPASRMLSIRCHRQAKRPRGWRGRSGESAVCRVLDPDAMWWARGDLNPHVHKDTRT